MSKITAEHLARSAIVYIRQSTADQLVPVYIPLIRSAGDFRPMEVPSGLRMGFPARVNAS